jgi:hypothetical protein
MHKKSIDGYRVMPFFVLLGICFLSVLFTAIISANDVIAVPFNPPASTSIATSALTTNPATTVEIYEIYILIIALIVVAALIIYYAFRRKKHIETLKKHREVLSKLDKV